MSVADANGRTAAAMCRAAALCFTTAWILLAALARHRFTPEPDPATGYGEPRIDVTPRRE